MVNDAKRFLALNALIHGYTPEEAFPGDPAEILALGDKETATLLEKLNGLERKPATSDPLTATLLNFYRCDDYAFLSLRGQYILRLADFADDDFNGRVEKGMSNGVIANLLRDYGKTQQEGNPYIVDGVLFCSEKEFSGVQKAMQDAYKLLTKGPSGLNKKLNLMLRQHTSLPDYVPFSPVSLLEILDGLIDAKIHPTVCQSTFLKTPDLLATYKETGCIMAFNTEDHASIDWLLDVKGSDDLATSVRVSLTSVKSHLLTSLRDLQGAYAEAVRGRGTYSVRFAED